MDADARHVVEDCTRASDDGSISFPQVVARLAEAGVEQYHADLRRAEKTYYVADDSSHVVSSRAITACYASAFSAEGVEAAVRASQAGEIGYAQFCERIAAAGCIGYLVSLVGRRAVYFGRTGESHVELFPAQH
jgi:uncharacterized protein YbcV (DUF1398 family)